MIEINKSRLIGLLRYFTSVTLGIGATALSVMLLLEAPGASQAQAETPTVATLKASVKPKPLPQLRASDFDIARSVKVEVKGKPEPKTVAAPVQVASADATAPALTGTAIVGADAVNLRSGPSKSTDKVGVIRSGAEVRVLEIDRGWTRVEAADGAKGWMASKFLNQ